MKKQVLLISIVLTLFGFQNSAFWAITDNCGNLDWYELYECRVTSICKQTWWGTGFKFKPSNVVYNTDTQENDYQKLEAKNPSYLTAAKEKYRDNMNNIYKCALIKTQIAALNNIVDPKKTKMHADIAWKIGKKIAARLQNLNQQKQICGDADSDTPYNKKNVLKQASYEVCKYLNYLDYLDDYADFENLVTQETTISSAAKQQIRSQQLIQQEIDNTIKIFPLAFTAYSQYENNISIHYMLELIREDFIIFRDRLHKTLWPISQLIYKAINSSSKQQ